MAQDLPEKGIVRVTATSKRTLAETALANAKEEFADYTAYKELSKSEKGKNADFKVILARLADTLSLPPQTLWFLEKVLS